MTAQAYGSRSIRRRRRTAEEMEAIRQAIQSVLEDSHPMSVRQVYYQLTTLGAVEKTEREYKTVVRLLGEMRRDGSIPYLWLADATRWMRKPDTYDSAVEAVEQLASAYRRNLWAKNDVVELWLEKEALAGVLVEVTERWDVPLMVTRGYPSISYLYSAAEQVLNRWLNGRQTFIYYMGDHDPSGVDIDNKVLLGIGEAMRRIASGYKLWDKVECRLIDNERSRVRSVEGREATVEELEQLRSAVSATVFGRGSKEWERVRNVFAFATFGGHFTRLGVLPWQIEEWALPSRPTKSTDTRSKNFEGESVELDAIPSNVLRGLAEEAVQRHVDSERLEVLEKVEEEERRGLEQLAAGFRGEE